MTSTGTLKRKIEANSYLPRIARGFVAGELTLDDLVDYFRYYAHLYSVGLDTNAACNLHCQYCYLEEYNSESAPKYADLENFFRVIRDLEEMGTDLIALVGKEPFLDTRGIRLLEYMDQISEQGRKFRFGVVTNGTMIDRFVERIPSSIAYIDVSLDGTELINDSLRGNGVFKKACANIRTLADAGFEVWTSSVIHSSSCTQRDLIDFIKTLALECGCPRFYFSPVRNFTGNLGELLLAYEAINRVQDIVASASEKVNGIRTVILDHPYEAVWRDYIWPGGRSSLRFDRLVIDGFGNVLDQLSERCFRKLDVFPHSPWATCRIDARGEFLPDVEGRTYRDPVSVGSITKQAVGRLHESAVNDHLRRMVGSFLANMQRAKQSRPVEPALTTVSIPGRSGAHADDFVLPTLAI